VTLTVSIPIPTARLVRRGLRRAVRRLASVRSAAVVVAAAFGLTGGLLTPVGAEASTGPLCSLGFGCAATSIDTGPPSIDVTKSLGTPTSSFTVPKSIVQFDSPTIDQFKQKKPPKVTPKLIAGTGIAAAAVTCAIRCFQPGGSGPKGPKRQTSTVTKPVTTQTKPHTFAPGPGQRPQPKPRKITLPPHGPQGPKGPQGPQIKPHTGTPVNSHNARKRNGPQQQGQPTKQKTSQKKGSGPAEHTNNARPSTKQKHQEGQATQQKNMQRGQANQDRIKRKNAAKAAAKRGLPKA
jgi:hypothetical protein